jgi:hypothetical protein
MLITLSIAMLEICLPTLIAIEEHVTTAEGILMIKVFQMFY